MIVVTGSLGAAAAGLRLSSGRTPPSDEERAAILRHLRPTARVGEAGVLARFGATAMIDVSDGLTLDLSRLCAASGVGARVRLADVPIGPAASLDEALGGGEDYELVATLPDAARAGAAREELDEAFGVGARRDRRDRERARPARGRRDRRRGAPHARGMGPFRVNVSPRPRALTIAGSDSGGGAGIQADLKTFSALGVFGMTAITAVTVQNTMGVSGYEALSAELVGDQIRAVATDIGVDAAKTGMLANASIVEAVADAVAETGIGTLVVDPVFVSKHGHALLAAEAVDVLRVRLLPLATLVTPNLPEAAGLAGIEVRSRDDMRRAADAILATGVEAVLVKGGHLEGSDEASDLLVDAGGRDLALDAADRHAQHARDGVHAERRDRGASRPGRRPEGRRRGGEGLRDRGHPSCAPARRWDRAGRPALVDPAALAAAARVGGPSGSRTTEGSTRDVTARGRRRRRVRRAGCA